MEATAIEKELSRAVRSGNLPTLMSVLARDDVKRAIMEKKGDWDWDNDGAPLHLAADLGYYEMFTILVNAGIDAYSYMRKSDCPRRFAALHLCDYKFSKGLGDDPWHKMRFC